MEKIQLKSKTTLFQKFVGVVEYIFHLPDRKTDIRRFVVTRPEAAALLLYNRDSDSIVFIRQFRTPVYTKDENAFILEIPAGVIEAGESAMDTIVRESLEETGYQISNPELLSVFYPSPGMLNEKMHLFYAEVGHADKIGNGGGLESENEFLEILEIPVKEALEMVFDGRIIDAKTILSVLWFRKKPL
ncbi:NUDIX domain-containing protein [Bacteroidota bacterium]